MCLNRFQICWALLMWFLFPFHSFGQGEISGRIVDQNGSVLEFIHISIQTMGTGSLSDSNGLYKIENIPFGEHQIVVSHMGYVSEKSHVRLDRDHRNVVLDFQLKEALNSLNEVVVSGTMKELSKLDSPVPVEVYSANYFKANPSPSIFESLQNVNGVRPQMNCNVCNTGDIHINGLEGSYSMVLIDGMPIVSGLSTVYGLTGIPQFLIERVEIVKGPASTLYGSEAVGGLINIITKKPGNSPSFSADIFATDWGESNSDLGFTYKLGESVKGLLGVNYFNYQNPIDNNKDGFTDLTLQNRISLFHKLHFTRRDKKLSSLAARYVYEDRWGGEMDWDKSFRGGNEIYGESIYTSRWEVFGVYQLPLDEILKLQYSGNGHNQNSAYGETFFKADQYIGFAQLTWDKSISNQDFLFGAAYRYTYYDDNTAVTAMNNEANDPVISHLPGLFVQDEIEFNSFHKLLLGLRWDFNSLHGNIFSPRINYKWNSPNNKSVIRISLGNGFRVANVFTEDHAALTGARELVFAEELNPETSWNANVNWVHTLISTCDYYLSLDASAFYTYFDNSIIPDYESDPNKIIYSNLDGSAISQGISMNVDFVWSKGLKVLAGATLMDVSIHNTEGAIRQILTENFSGVWSISYSFKKINLSLDYTGNLYGPMRLPLLGELDDRDAFSQTYSLQNIQLTKGIGEKWEVYAGIKNLLNFTAPANSIARAFDPFDKNVLFDANGQVIPSPSNPNALTFDPTYVYAPNQGIRGFVGFRFNI